MVDGWEPTTAPGAALFRPSTINLQLSITLNHWLVKSEPASYAWETFVKDRRAAWTGVRNFQARNNLRAMRKGDLVLFYHSVTDKQIVGIAKVAKEAYPDPTATEGDWSCVDLVPVKAITRPVTLAAIKASAPLKNIALVRNSRISVVPLTPDEYSEILRLGAG
jgi:predicted RNA-binding protein with PUA-like domain